MNILSLFVLVPLLMLLGLWIARHTSPFLISDSATEALPKKCFSLTASFGMPRCTLLTR